METLIKYVRVVVKFLLSLVTLLLFFISGCIAFILPAKNMVQKRRQLMVVATWGCQAMLSILRVKVIIRNKEIFESEKNWYIMGNHMSYIDILMLLGNFHTLFITSKEMGSKPILGQINSAGLSDVLIAVVRYFGGVKLGTSGLTEAYRLGAAQVIDKAEIVTAYVERNVPVLYTYNMTNVVMKAVKDLEVRIVSQDWGAFPGKEREYECKTVLRGKLSVADELEKRLTAVVATQAAPEIKIDKTDNN